MKKTKNPEDIKNIINNVIKKIEKKGPGKKEKIYKLWGDVAGEMAMAHSRPIGIKKGILTIEIDSSTWLYELNIRKNELLLGLKKEIEGLKDIRFKMGDIG